MKKTLAILMIAVMLLVSCAIGVSAEGALNASEQKIIDLLSTSVTKNGAEYKIPTEYVNQAKAYFLTVDLSEEDGAKIIDYINKGIALLKEQSWPTGTTVNVASFDSAVRKQVLQLAKDACAVTNLTLTYDGTNVSITDGTTSVFSAAPIVKTTGASVDMTMVVVMSAAVLAVFGAAFVVAKKAHLFAK